MRVPALESVLGSLLFLFLLAGVVDGVLRGDVGEVTACGGFLAVAVFVAWENTR